MNTKINIRKPTKAEYFLSMCLHCDYTAKRIVFFCLVLMTIILCIPSEAGCLERGGIEFVFANAQIENVNSADYLSFDVMVKGTATSDRLGTGMVLMNYNSAVFGYRVKNNNNLITTKGSLLMTSPGAYYSLYTMDNLATRLAITYEYLSVTGNGNPLSLEYQQLVNVKIRIQNSGLSAGLSFHASGMSPQQYLDDNATLFSPVVAFNMLNDILPIHPAGLVLNLQEGYFTLSWEAVPGCSYNVYSTTDPECLSWYLEEFALIASTWSSPLSSGVKFFYVTALSSQSLLRRD